MARKAEEGLEYFPLNTDIVHNPKVKLVVAEFGSKAWAVIIPLFCKIYREKGYWLDWHDEETRLLFAQDDSKCELAFVDEVVSGCIRRRLFDKAVFDMFGILSSDRIQENFLEARRRQKSVRVIAEFLLLDENVTNAFQNVTFIPLNVDIITKNVNAGTQKRREEKQNRREGDNAPHSPPPEIEFPFGENFRKQWEQWKSYKKIELKFNYKSPQSEQASLQDLVKKANGIEENAIAIIQRSMANGWKGFFELKNEIHGSSKQSATNVSTQSAFDKIDMLHSQNGS